MFGNLLAQIVTRRAALQHEHFEIRRKPRRFPPPIVKHRSRANHQRRIPLRFEELRPCQPCQRLQSFSQTHVVRQNAAQIVPRQVAQKIEPRLLIRAQLRLDPRGQRCRRDATEFLQALAQRLPLRRVAKFLQLRFIQMRHVLQTESLRHRHKPVHSKIGKHFVRLLHSVRV